MFALEQITSTLQQRTILIYFINGKLEMYLVDIRTWSFYTSV